MRKYLFALLVLVAAGTTLLVAAFAVAGERLDNISAQDGRGLPGASRDSTTGSGSFEAKVNDDDSSFDWTLSYAGLEGNVTQSHIHSGKRSAQRHIPIGSCTARQRRRRGRRPVQPRPRRSAALLIMT